MVDRDVYTAVYYVKGDSVARASSVERIPSGSATFVTRPSRKIFYDRYLVISEQEEKLTLLLTLKQFHESVTSQTGDAQGFEFFVIEDPSHLLRIYNNLEWKLRPFQSTVEQLPEKFWQLPVFSQISKLLKDVYEKYLRNPFSGKQAVVRQGLDISSEEKAFIQLRLLKVKKAIENLLKHSISNQQIPRISLCMSGGGYRTMIASLGFLMGAQNGGLLDCSLYMAGLSGSTWLMVPWLESKKSITEYKELLKPKITQDLFHGAIDSQEITQALVRKLVFNQPLSLVDMYGALLAQKLLVGFGKDPQDIYLYAQTEYLKEAHYPYPIYTAIIPVQEYEWFEFTPHEVGSTYLKSFVPSWAFGRYFSEGKSVISIEPPMSLGFMMGICGSAFSANLREYLESIEKTINPPQLRELLYMAIANPVVGTARISAASVYNPAFTIHNTFLNRFKKITLVDAGIEFNVPIPPLLRIDRKADIIIILDASADLRGAPALAKAQAYAQQYKLPFPVIDYTGIGSKICSIFHDPNDPQVPVIIYFPLVNNANYGAFNPADFMSSHLNTYNFIYTAEQIEQLSGLMAFNVQESLPVIKEVIEKVIERKELK
jgi:phospholipase A2